MGCRDKAHPSFERDPFHSIRDTRVKLILDKQQQVAPVVLLEIAKNSQGHFHVLVRLLTLPIHLRMIGTRYTLLDI
jgi:hypothetical protein